MKLILSSLMVLIAVLVGLGFYYMDRLPMTFLLLAALVFTVREFVKSRFELKK